MKGLAAAVTLLLALAGAAEAQTAESSDQLIARWTASDTTCRNPAVPAVDAVGACEQRDTLAKVLALAGFCHASAMGRSGPAWTRCAAQQAATRGTAQFQRMGGVFVLSARLNGGTQVYFIVDSGAATVQIPEEAVEEMKRNGTLTEADFMGQHRFILADGRTMQQRVFRLRTLQIGDRTMENVLATMGAPKSRALLGQSFLRRLNWWKIDNVKNAIEFEFTGAF
ncbi:clan AA aspartic protease, TIGR02281 family [Rhodospirillales bacterium URHD0017]|nr:clan AA aspartic protease, TIGR02281 family [Rhodospirillales bacterium URHD0017]